MAMCWKFRPNNRPSFGEILELLNPDLSESFRDVSYYFNESNQKHTASDADDDILTDDAKTPLTTPHYVDTPMASSLQHHSSSMRGGSTSSHLLSDELDYQDENIVSGSSGGSSLDRSHSPLPCLHNSPCECVPLTSFGGAARTKRTPGGSYWNAPAEPPCVYGRRSNPNSAIHSNRGATENHINGSDSLGGGNGHPRNGLANGHIPMSHYPSGANRVWLVATPVMTHNVACRRRHIKQSHFHISQPNWLRCHLPCRCELSWASQRAHACMFVRVYACVWGQLTTARNCHSSCE